MGHELQPALLKGKLPYGGTYSVSSTKSLSLRVYKDVRSHYAIMARVLVVPVPDGSTI